MSKYKYSLLFGFFLTSLLNIANAEKLNRAILKDLGYSTATGGFVSIGYARAIDNKNLLSSFIGSWSRDTGNYYGVGYKYFFENQSTDSWFLDAEIQKNEVYRGDFRDSSTLVLLGGHQWVFGEAFGFDLQSGLSYSDISRGRVVLISMNFSYLF